jgi:hypothetical protein
LEETLKKAKSELAKGAAAKKAARTRAKES